ncbi:cyclase family protein [Haloparvum sp. AD34]
MFRDCSQPIDSGMPTYPGDPEVSLTAHATHESDGYSVQGLRCGSHTGTHVDAPRHTEPDGATLDEGDVGDWVFEAQLVDLAPFDPREPIGADAFPTDLDADVDLLVVRTGWEEYWGEPRYRDHPYLTREFATRCRDAGVGVGLDTFGPDPTSSGDDTEVEPAPDEPKGVPAHHVLLGGELQIVENLRNLESLPTRFTLYAFPIPLADGDGAPVRAVAEWD